MTFGITFALTLGMLILLMSAMAVGVIFARRELQGSCGGVGASCACDAAGKPRACEQGDVGPQVAAPLVTLGGRGRSAGS